MLAVRVVAPVPQLATGRVPVTPVVRGRPVTFVITPLAGVPRAGVTSVGLVRVLFVRVSVEFLDTRVSVAPVGSVRIPPDTVIAAILGVMRAGEPARTSHPVPVEVAHQRVFTMSANVVSSRTVLAAAVIVAVSGTPVDAVVLPINWSCARLAIFARVTALLVIVRALVLLAEPSNEEPALVTSPVAVPIVRGVARAVAVQAFPDTLVWSHVLTFEVFHNTTKAASLISLDVLILYLVAI